MEKRFKEDTSVITGTLQEFETLERVLNIAITEARTSDMADPQRGTVSPAVRGYSRALRETSKALATEPVDGQVTAIYEGAGVGRGPLEQAFGLVVGRILVQGQLGAMPPRGDEILAVAGDILPQLQIELTSAPSW